MSAPRSTTSAKSRVGRATATLLCALLAGLVAVQPAAVATARSTTHGAAVSRAEAAPWAAAPRILGNGEPGSLDAARYLGQYWSLVYGTSVDSFPDCFRLGPGGRVPFAPTFFGAECTIREGDPVFAEGSTTAVSSLEEPFSSRETVQRRTARELDHAFLRSSLLSVDGGPPVELRARRFEVVTRQQIVHLPENNVFGPGVEPQTITLTAHGWMATVRGLTPGLHHLTWTRVTDSGAGPEQEIRDQTIRVLDRR